MDRLLIQNETKSAERRKPNKINMALPQGSQAVESLAIDAFESNMYNQVDRLNNCISRAEKIAIRFRGDVPKTVNDSDKKELKICSKIEDLNKLHDKFRSQLSELESVLCDLERI